MNNSFVEKAKTWDSNPQVLALADLFSAELDKIVPDHSSLVLEFGCGTGLVRLRAASLDMVDASTAILEVHKDGASHVTVHEGTLSELLGRAVAPQSADWITCHMAPRHVEDIPALLGELYRLIKPDRLCDLDLDPNPEPSHTGGRP